MLETTNRRARAAHAGGTAGATNSRASPGSILIVDDNPDDLLLCKRTLKRVNPTGVVHSVLSGKEMIAYLQGDGVYSNRGLHPYPELLLLDLHMPEMDGFDVLVWLSENPAHAKLRVVMLSGEGEWKRIEKAYKLGARSFLTKPLSGTDFMTTVRAIGFAGR